jgi:maleate cis-trans isomerase
MFEDYVPKHKIGCLCPLAVIDTYAYEFYQLAPRDVMTVMVPLGLQEFSAQDVERVFASVDEKVDLLVERGVDIIYQSGVPLPILIGPEALKRLLDHMATRTTVPVTAQVLGVVAAAKRLGVKKVAAANKWTEAMNRTLGQFFAREGISLIGANTRVMAPSEFLKWKNDASLNLAYDLGRGAFEKYPEADAVYIGGGSWLTLPVITRLEEEFGQPVITNQVASVWHLLNQLNCWKPIEGHGRLLLST